MKKIILSLLMTVMCLPMMASNCKIIPYPNTVIEKNGKFEFSKKLTVSLPSQFAKEADILKTIFADDYNINIIESSNGQIVVKQNKDLSDEAYTLNVTPEKILIEASSSKGCFYAFQSLRQTMTRTIKGGYSIPACQINDEPALTWRAYMLDEGRNFQGSKVVKSLLDQMALLKFNKFHWHLTEDQGWRIEIKKYPLLTEVGAWRDSCVVRKVVEKNGKVTWLDNQPYSSKPVGGFYTQEEIKEIVLYAAKRHIEIIPEIEMPGHASAAIAAYPWLLSDSKNISVPVNYGIKEYAYNVANERVYTFMEDVLSEVIALFPGSVIHIGGDEVRTNTWENNNDIKSLMEREKLTSFADVQIYFTNRISNFIQLKGKRMMGWNEILGNVHMERDSKNATSKLAQSSVIHFWKGDSAKIIDALKKGYDVVNSWNQYTYLDYVSARLPMAKIYNFAPIPKGLTPEQEKHLIGVGYQMWGEVTVRPLDVYSFTFPRIAAAAEVAWTKEENKNFDRFNSALKDLKLYWDQKGILYFQE